LVRIGPTAWPFTGFIHTYIHTDRQLDKYILDEKLDNICFGSIFFLGVSCKIYCSIESFSNFY
jgi:hypothetical protein